MKKEIWLFFVVVGTIVVLWRLASFTMSSATQKKLIITGSSTIAPLLIEIASQFEKLYPHIRVDVQMGGSSRGIADVEKGLSDIGMVSRDSKENERHLKWHAVALDGIAMIVHQSNTLQSLTEEQIRAIYRGTIKNWNELGGREGICTVIHKADGRSTLELFLHYFKLEAKEVQAQVIIGDNQQGIKTVVGNPNAIAYVSIGTAEYEAKHGTPIKLLRLGEVEATVANIRNKTFPLSRTLHLVTRETPQGIQKEFIDYCLSSQVYSIIEAQYFVPIQK